MGEKLMSALGLVGYGLCPLRAVPARIQVDAAGPLRMDEVQDLLRGGVAVHALVLPIGCLPTLRTVGLSDCRVSVLVFVGDKEIDMPRTPRISEMGPDELLALLPDADEDMLVVIRERVKQLKTELPAYKWKMFRQELIKQSKPYVKLARFASWLHGFLG